MKATWWFLWLTLCAGAGCVTLPTAFDLSGSPPAPVAPPPASPAPPVSSEEVTDANAQEKAQALLRELDRDEERLTPPPAKGEKKK